MGGKAYTDEQILAAVEQAGTKAGAARLLQTDERSLKKRIKRINARRNGGEEEEAKPGAKDPGHRVAKRTTLYDCRTGGEMIEWVQGREDDRQRELAMAAARQAFAEEIPRVNPIDGPSPCNADLMNVFPLADLHIGGLSWAEETGGDWDTHIAETLLYRIVSQMVKSAPSADRAVLLQLGDIAHYDSLEAITPTHGNVLDADTRFQKMIRVVIRAMRCVIDMLLMSHRQVDVVMVEGNHDLASSAWLKEAFRALYEAEPRVVVDDTPKPYHCIEHGNTSVFAHHGHKCKLGQVEQVWVNEFREVYGRTKYSYGHVGDQHHHEARESNLMKSEMHQTIAPRSSCAARIGGDAGRSAQVITYSAEHGEVGRSRVTPEMVQK